MLIPVATLVVLLVSEQRVSALDAAPARPDQAHPVDDSGGLRWAIPSLHAAGVLLLTRVAVSVIWPDSFGFGEGQDNAGHFVEAWTRPPLFDESRAFFEWDGDPWAINSVAHGLMGSEIYLRYRQAGHATVLVLGMTALWGAVWEYLVESWHKRPSSVDLVWTAAGGLLLGEGRYRLYRLIGQMRPTTWRTVLLYVVDPLGQLERDLLGLPF